MDVATLLQEGMPTLTANATEGAENNTKQGILYNIIDHLGVLVGSQFGPLLHILMALNNLGGLSLGLDPAIILAAFGFFWLAEQFFYQIYNKVQALLYDYFTSEVSVDESDEIYDHILNWLATHPSLMNALSLRIGTYFGDCLAEEEEPVELEPPTIGPDGSGISINFSEQRRKRPPQFTPSYGRHRFWHNGRLFWLERKRVAMEGSRSNEYQGEIVLSCYGRSTAPIKELFEQAKQQYFASRNNRTVVYRPRGTGNHAYPIAWKKTANRHARPMSTVVLDAKQKVDILTDMNEFLSSAAATWYARRGIPLRRGYLFHGPPGTGKTSLSFALAGVFGLNVYVMSLLDPSLDEQGMMSLFNDLPTRCIVLLEDIDSAGITHSRDTIDQDYTAYEAVEEAKKHIEGEKHNEGEKYNEGEENYEDESGEKASKESGEKEEGDTKKTPVQQNGDVPSPDNFYPESDWNSDHEFVCNMTFAQLAHKLSLFPLPAMSRQPALPQPSGISLSGLLNAIDGVASQEGRVLVMTTNKPEALDEALIRPGRVDLQVCFTNATRTQAQELFVRMYVADSTTPKPTAMATVTESKDSKPAAVPTTLSDEPPITTDELERVAADFAAQIPEGRLISPAEIQGYLLKRKKTPRRAAAEVGMWVQGLMEQKAKRTKVVAVQ